MATKLGRVITYVQKTPPTKSRDLLIRGHVRNLKPYNCISTIPIGSKFGRLVFYSWRTQPAKSRDLFIIWSLQKLKNLYIHFNKTYGSQTWQGGDLGWGHHPPTHVNVSPSGCVVIIC